MVDFRHLFHYVWLSEGGEMMKMLACSVLGVAADLFIERISEMREETCLKRLSQKFLWHGL